MKIHCANDGINGELLSMVDMGGQEVLKFQQVATLTSQESREGSWVCLNVHGNPDTTVYIYRNSLMQLGSLRI